MKLSHWSVKYQTLQKVDRLSGIKRNLRPLQMHAMVAAVRERGTHERKQS